MTNIRMTSTPSSMFALVVKLPSRRIWIICKNFEVNITVYSNSERPEKFLVTEYFLTCCSWRFLRSNELEQLEFKLEKVIGI